jgi:hypothetical protein
MESRYRADVKSSKVAGKQGDCAKDADIVKSITDGWADDAAEEDHCDKDKCVCDLPNWPATWATLEANVTYTAAYVSMGCKANVTITYDWQYQERRAPCYRKAPTKSGK